MLVRAFSTLAKCGSVSIHYWLNYFLPDVTVGKIHLIRDYALIETQSGDKIKITNGLLYKKLKRGKPKFTIPLLVDICRLYDSSIEVDKILTHFLNDLLKTNFKLLPFYINAGKLVTSVDSKTADKTELKGCKAVTKTRQKETVLQLNSSKRLQALLVNVVRRQAL